MNNFHKTNEELKKELLEIEAAKADPDKFAVLYDRYFKHLFIFIYRRTGDEELSADIAQHVFMKAMINIKKYEFKGVPFSAWLFRIAMNEINMYFRKTNKERVVSLEKDHISNLISEVKEDNNEENNRSLMKALSTLRPEEMQLIELRFFEDRAFAEIGAITGITENNAKVKLYRILDKLKLILKGKV